MSKNDSKNNQNSNQITQGLAYAVFWANSLKKNPICIESTLEKYLINKHYSIYSNQSLLRVLAKRVNLLTKDLTEKLFETSTTKELTIILKWKDSEYAYATIDLDKNEHAEYLSNNQDELISYFNNLIPRSL